MFGSEEESIHIGELNGIVVKQKQLSNSATRQHLCDDAAHSTNAHNSHCKASDSLITKGDINFE
jgi:hypothetical protein